MASRLVARVFSFLVAFSASCDAFDAFKPGLTRLHTARPNVQHRLLSALSMKTWEWKKKPAQGHPYDWKKKAADPREEYRAVAWSLDNLKAAPGMRKPKTRKGRGHSAGQGETCGFGNRGQKSRSGSGVKPGFEGNQMPLYRRLPKFVGRPMGSSYTPKNYAPISLSALNKAKDGETVDWQALRDIRAVNKNKYMSKSRKYKLAKVVNIGKLDTKNLIVKANAFDPEAKAAIEANGGKTILLGHKMYRRPKAEVSV
jgi:large subunit ribosomal protein L15